ncbi:MAG: universal stress protein [Halobacteriaceae archaeon]
MAPNAASDEYRVAVSVANPDHVDQLMRTAIDVARDRGGTVFVVSAKVVPRSSPVWVFRDEVIREEFGEQRQELLDRAVAAAADTGVPVEGRLVVADSVASGLLRVVEQQDIDALLMGWHARRRGDIVMGHIVDEVVAAAPCDVLVEKIGPTAGGVETVLLPAGEGDHTALAAAVSRAIAAANDATVEVVRVVDPDADEAARARAAELARDVAADVGPVATETAVVEGEDVVGALVAAAEARDVTVIGGGRGGRLRRFVVGSTAREVGRRADATVVVATRNRSVRSRLSRLRNLVGSSAG